jgi:hypothetical protein
VEREISWDFPEETDQKTTSNLYASVHMRNVPAERKIRFRQFDYKARFFLEITAELSMGGCASEAFMAFPSCRSGAHFPVNSD